MDYYQSYLSRTLKFLGVCSFIFESIAFGDVIFGANLALSFPQPLKVGGDMYCTDPSVFCGEEWRYYLEGGYFAYPFSASSRSINALSFELGARFFPWGPNFYVGMGMGYRKINIITDISAFQIDGESLATNANLLLNTLYLGPSLGMSFFLGKGFYLGADFGIQLAMVAVGSINLINSNTGETSDNSGNLKVTSGTAMGRIAKLLVPSFTLVRLTYFFE